MNITREDAASALRDVDAATARSREARAYRVGGPHLVVWGVVWLIGYTLTGLLPSLGLIREEQLGLPWLALSLVGVACDLILARRTRLAAAAPRDLGKMLAPVAICAFIFATYLVMRPHSTPQYEVFPALVVGLSYVLAGLITGAGRYAVIGVLVFGLALAGFFLLGPLLPYGLAVIGGGGLILGGLWLKGA